MIFYKYMRSFKPILYGKICNGFSKCYKIAKTGPKKSFSTQANVAVHETVLPYDKIPGPSTLPVIGSLLHFVPGGRYNGLDLANLAEKLYLDFGDIVRLTGLPGREDYVFVYDFDDMQKIFRTEGKWPARPNLETREHYLKERRSDIFKSVYGLIHSQGQEWQDIRSKVNQPMMQMKITKQYVGWIEEIVNDFIVRLQFLLDAEGNVPSDFITEVDRWSLESIARIAIDTRLGCLDFNLNEQSDGMRLVKSIQRLFNLGFELEFLPSLWKYISTPSYNELMGLYDCFTEIAVKHISQAIKRLEENPAKDENNLSVLEKLLKIDPQVAIVMALDMFFAGVDTTASSVIAALYLLAKNPEKQALLREEIRAVLPHGARITSESLNRLSYLKACLKETHRMRPVAIGNSRMAGEDLVLQGYSIPKGTQIIMHSYVASKYKNQYPDHNSYIPERWLRENTDGTPSARCAHKFAYLPFGFGIRMCAGRRFAELEMEVFTAKIIDQFQVDWYGPDMQFKSTLIAGPDGPMRFKFTSIK